MEDVEGNPERIEEAMQSLQKELGGELYYFVVMTGVYN
jgi:hypothetical protein